MLTAIFRTSESTARDLARKWLPHAVIVARGRLVAVQCPRQTLTRTKIRTLCSCYGLPLVDIVDRPPLWTSRDDEKTPAHRRDEPQATHNKITTSASTDSTQTPSPSTPSTPPNPSPPDSATDDETPPRSPAPCP